VFGVLLSRRFRVWGNWKTEVAESKDSSGVVIEKLENDGGFLETYTANL